MGAMEDSMSDFQGWSQGSHWHQQEEAASFQGHSLPVGDHGARQAFVLAIGAGAKLHMTQASPPLGRQSSHAAAEQTVETERDREALRHRWPHANRPSGQSTIKQPHADHGEAQWEPVLGLALWCRRSCYLGRC